MSASLGHLLFSLQGPDVQALSSCFFCFYLVIGMKFSPLIPPVTMCVSFFGGEEVFVTAHHLLSLREQGLLSSCRGGLLVTVASLVQHRLEGAQAQ